MPVLFTSNFHYHYRMPTHEYEPMGGMPNGGIGPIPIPIPIPPMGGGGAKLPPAPGPPIPGIGGAGKARGSSCKGMQSQSCYSSKPALEQHQGESNRNRQRGTMQNIPSFPAKSIPFTMLR
nr:hypothetical protein Iba_chr05eCG15930 [Ipomoea batatas]